MNDIEITIANYVPIYSTGGASAWGSITGTLSAQTDLQNALNAKQNTITNSDSITQGSTNLFLTTTERTKLNNTTNTNSGDQTAATVPNTPAGRISATNVQTALNELDTEKAPIDTPTFINRANIPLIRATGAGGVRVETNLGNIVVDIGASAGGTVFHGNARLNAETASRVLITNSSKDVKASSVTNTELGYLSGVTSSIQTQINLKLTKSQAIYQAQSVVEYGASLADTTGASLQTALDSMFTAGIKTAILPEGIWQTSSTITTKINLVGLGRNSTIIKANNGLNADVLNIQNSESYRVYKGFRVDGNAVNQTAGKGIYVNFPGASNFEGDFILFEEIFVKDFKDDGIKVENTGGGMTIAPIFNNVQVLGNNSGTTALNGYSSITTGSGVVLGPNIYDVDISSLDVGCCYNGYGLDATGINGSNISNSKFWQCKSNLRLQSSRSVKFTDCVFDYALQWNVDLANNYDFCTFINCTFRKCNLDANSVANFEAIRTNTDKDLLFAGCNSVGDDGLGGILVPGWDFTRQPYTSLFLPSSTENLRGYIENKNNTFGYNNGSGTNCQLSPINIPTQTLLNSKLNKSGDTLTGTAGSGFYGAISQSSAPPTPSDGFRLFADSSGRMAWKGTNGFLRIFDGVANTVDRTYILPDSSGTVALTSDIPKPLSVLFPFHGHGAVAVVSQPATPSLCKVALLEVAIPTTVDAVLYPVGSVSSGNVRAGIYQIATANKNDASNTFTGSTLIADSGTVAQGTASNIQTLTFTPITLQPGKYFIALMVDNATGTFMRHSNGATGLGWACGYTATGFAFTTPAPAPTDTTFNNVPGYKLRVVTNYV